MAADAARAKSLFLTASDLPDAVDRAAYLDHECGTDAALRLRVEALLAALGGVGRGREHDHLTAGEPAPPVATATFVPGDRGTVDLPSDPPATGTFGPEGRRPSTAATGAHMPDGPAGTFPGTPTGRNRSPAVPSGAVIAQRYTLVELIGEGGMGSVFLATQSEPVKRQVALKLIKAGMDSKQVLARFDAERQALALMDHPHIAKVFDGGSTPAGQPFFVMELVSGIPINDYCDRKRMSVRERLELFVSVCQAVQHAHQKGVIHRDLKPGNVLVAEVDGRPTPKVIDFGVAKATERKLTDLSFSDTGVIVGTPAYMSPEQADPSSMDIDTRTDVYALGVILYELLVGSPPLDASQFKRGAVLEMLRMVREVDPPRPSTKLSTAEAAPSIAANRDIEPAKLTRLLRGELDWVVMKALEKDRTRRYESANGLARDVQRYLADEVVKARPPSPGYRLKKLVRRHRGQVIAASLIALALIGGLIGTTVSYFEARKQEGLARGAAARETARADELEVVSDYQANMLSNVQAHLAGQALTKNVKDNYRSALVRAGLGEEERAAREKSFDEHWQRVNAIDTARGLIDTTILKPAVEALDRFKDQPAVDARLRQAAAERYMLLGLYDPPMPLLRTALELRQQLFGPDHVETLRTHHLMGTLQTRLGKRDAAEPHFRAVAEATRRTMGDDHADTFEALGVLGDCLRQQRRFDEAKPLLTDSLAGLRRLCGSEDQKTLVALNMMGQWHDTRKEWDAAEPYWREAYETGKRVKGDDDPEVLIWLTNYASLLGQKGELNRSEALEREALERRRRVMGVDHPDTTHALYNLGRTLQKLNRPAEAEPLLRESMERRRRMLGPDHPNTLMSMASLADVLQSIPTANSGEAEALLREVLATRRRVFGADDRESVVALDALGNLLRRRNRLTEAEAALREVVERNRRRIGSDHVDTLKAVNTLGVVHLQQGQPALAEPLCREAVERGRRVVPPDDPELLIWLSNFASALRDLGKLAEAEPIYREILETSRRKQGDNHPTTQAMQRQLGNLLRDRGKLDEAEPILRDLLEKRRKQGPDLPDTITSATDFARLLLARDKPAEALALLAPFEAVARKLKAPSAAQRLTSVLLALGQIRTRLGEYAAAEATLLELHPRLTTPLGFREGAQAFVTLYDAWHAAEPGKGHDAKAADWKRKLPKGP